METTSLPRSFLSAHVEPNWQSNPFKATLLWERIVLHLEMSIKCGRHTHGLKIYDNCFRGGRAVACLSSYINTVLLKTVSREQVLTLCHKLVTTGVMEDVRDEEKTMFKEGRLYRFSKDHFWETPATENTTSSSPHLLAEGTSSPNRCRSVGDIRKEMLEVDSVCHRPLATSVSYASDSTIAVSGHMNRNEHVGHLCPRQSSPFEKFQGSLINVKEEYERHLHGFTNEKLKLKKAQSCTLGDLKHFRVDRQPTCNIALETVKLSRRNAIKRASRPQRSGTTAVADDHLGVCRPVLPAQRSQSQSYRGRETTRRTYLKRKVQDEKQQQIEKEHSERLLKINCVSKFEPRKKEIEKGNDPVVRSYCIDSNPGHQLFFVNHVNLIGSKGVCLIHERKSRVPDAPTGTKWVVYGYL